MATLIQKSRGVPAAVKATYQQFEGKTLRKFFGLSTADEEAIEREVGLRLDVNLARTEGKAL